jgi:hypothetical protein
MRDSHAAISGAGPPAMMDANPNTPIRPAGACARQCEPCHIRFPASALSMMRGHSGHQGYGK